MTNPNVLLVVLDSVRASNTSLHDYPIDTTPTLKKFATDAINYTQARAPGIHSIASHASMFSGLEVEQHGLFEHESRLDPNASIWPELSRKEGYETGLFTPNVVVTEASNLADHFDHVVGPKRQTGPTTGLTMDDFDGSPGASEFVRRALGHDRPLRSLLNGLVYKFRGQSAHDPESEHGAVYISEFLDWIDRRQGPWAACINLMDTHYPYAARSEHQLYDDNQLRELLDYFDGPQANQVLSENCWWVLTALEYLYDECIQQADSIVDLLLRKLESRGLYDETLIVITSDHGEAFGEFSQVSPSVRLSDHSWGIHEVNTHIPLVVKPPGESRGRQVTDPASLTRFPHVVRETVAGSTASFAPNSERVFSSTFRVPDASLLPDCVNGEKYLGPWRAVYESDGDGVVKHATHAEDGVKIRVDSVDNCCVLSRSYPRYVDNLYDEMDDAGVKLGTRTTDREVESRLEALGYVR